MSYKPVASFSFFLSVLSKHSLFSKFIIISVIFGDAEVTEKRYFYAELADRFLFISISWFPDNTFSFQ